MEEEMKTPKPKKRHPFLLGFLAGLLPGAVLSALYIFLTNIGSFVGELF
jgi:hypothetical protein